MAPGRDGLDGPLLAGQALWDILGLPACPVPGGTLTRRGQRPTHWKEIPMKKPLENRRGWRWLLLLALCVGIAGAIFFLPHPVVQNVAETSIQGLQYQPQYGQEDGTLDPPTTLTDYDQAAVLACLSRYQEQRTLEKADGQEEDAGRFTMVLDVNGETKQLVLGEECYSYGADGWKYRIQNGNRLQQDLGKLLNLPVSA